MNTSLQDTTGLKVLAILISLMIWGWIQLNEEESTVKRVKVHYTVPANLIESKELPQTISVELVGAKGRIRQLDKIQLNLDIDLSDGHLGRNSRTLQEHFITNRPEGIQVERFSPPILDIEFDTPTVREIPVRINLVGTPNEDFKVGSVQSNPKTISIRGPEQYLNELEYISTKAININGIDESQSFSTQISLMNRTLSIQQANLLDVFVEIKDKNQVSVVPNLKTISNRLDWEIIPNTVSVLVESEDDSSTVQATELLVNVDIFIQALEKVDSLTDLSQKELQLSFEEHPELFTLLTKTPYTIRNIEPNTVVLKKLTSTPRQ